MVTLGSFAPSATRGLAENQDGCDSRRKMSRLRSDSLLLSLPADKPDFASEKKLMRSGVQFVAGIDEAGRGPLAGPVVAAAVILDPKKIPDGLDDSKRLTAKRREELFDIVTKTALACSISSISAPAIDATNILKASLEAMRRATRGLAIIPHHALIDGRDVAPGAALPCNGDDQRRSTLRFHCRGIHTCQGNARQNDEPDWQILSSLWIGIPCGLRNRNPSQRDGGTRSCRRLAPLQFLAFERTASLEQALFHRVILPEGFADKVEGFSEADVYPWDEGEARWIKHVSLTPEPQKCSNSIPSQFPI